MKRPKLLDTVPLGMYKGTFHMERENIRYIATGEFRCPQKGEYYLKLDSGRRIRGHHALATHHYLPAWIAERVRVVRCTCCQGEGWRIPPLRPKRTANDAPA